MEKKVWISRILLGLLGSQDDRQTLPHIFPLSHFRGEGAHTLVRAPALALRRAGG